MKAWLSGQSSVWCMVGTYLLPVPAGHGEMESRLESPGSGGTCPPPTAPALGMVLGCPTAVSHWGVTAWPPGMAALTCFKMEQLLESTL